MFSLTVCLVSLQACRGPDPKGACSYGAIPLHGYQQEYYAVEWRGTARGALWFYHNICRNPKSTCTLVSRIIQRFIWAEIFSSSLPTTSANLRPWFTRCAQNQLVFSLLLKDLVQRLHNLTIEVLSECIRGLPSNEPGAVIPACWTRTTCAVQGLYLLTCDEKGVHIHVSEYNSKLKKGAIIELEVILTL